ncbi:MAG TPA: TIGR00730 family Rossman fold protein [Ktedonobacterales bacterium]
MRRICVFAGSSKGKRPEYAEAAAALGSELVARGLGLVYGGASVGLMSIVADSVLAASGEVIGVLPKGLFLREVAHSGLTELHEVATMHERKALMSDLSDGFIALPGGLGTFDELFEITTWAQIGIHRKPIGLLDVKNYFAPLVALVDHAIAESFVPEGQSGLLLRDADPACLLDKMAHTRPARPPIWTESLPER